MDRIICLPISFGKNFIGHSYVEMVDHVAMNTLGKRLKECRKASGLKQQEVCAKIGIRQGTLSELENDKYPTSSYVPRFAELYGVEAIWLSEGKGPKHRKTITGTTDTSYAVHSDFGTPIIAWEKPEDLPEGEFVIVPRYDVHVAAGNGHVLYDEVLQEQGAAYRSDWVKKEGLYLRNLATVSAKGDSMEPSIYEGDALLVDRSQTTIQDGRVYILRFGDEIRVKRLFKRADGGIRIVSDNDGKYPEETVPAAEMPHIEILGRVVHKSGAV